ncbi:hypothetical protein CANCADRAFT_16324, partial [Tortispora caseinolytica NRRL Y-17796]
PQPMAPSLNNHHPLEARLRNWDAQQEEQKLQIQRNVYGVGVPLRRQFELKIVDEMDQKMGLAQTLPSIHRDILTGNDSRTDWEDIYPDEIGYEEDFHTRLERIM